MATLTIRDLDESIKRSLRIRAARRNRSMEEEARQILRAALAESPGPAKDVASRIRERFAGMGDVVLEAPPREPVRQAPDFGVDADSPASASKPRSARRRT